MEWTGLINPGAIREQSFIVEESHSAIHIGSGSHRVLATPWMITFMERTARQLLADFLPPGYSSVGVRVDIQHLAPTPVGNRVHVRAEVLTVEGSKVIFSVQVADELEIVGAGRHERVIIEEERFLRRVAKKNRGA
ncbi:MAG TPA: thioesterase family protein [Anaerolineales bacterium]|nr:thioesterase family protein [Anaerolineales bacterium]